jgi:hypothetical protein
MLARSADRRHPGGSVGGITTVAWTGQRGFCGDGGLATEATLNERLCCGPDIALYIAGFENVRIRKVCI